MSTPSDTAQAVTSTVHEQGSAVAGAAHQSAEKVVSEAKAQAANLGSEAQKQIQTLLTEAQREFSERATEQSAKAASGLSDLADELHALAEGRSENAPRVTGYVKEAANKVDSYSQRLEDGGFAGAVEDLSHFARRRPGVFLLGAVVAGFATGRLVRGAQKSSETQSSSAAQFPITHPAMSAPLPMTSPLPTAPPTLVRESAVGEQAK